MLNHLGAIYCGLAISHRAVRHSVYSRMDFGLLVLGSCAYASPLIELLSLALPLLTKLLPFLLLLALPLILPFTLLLTPPLTPPLTSPLTPSLSLFLTPPLILFHSFPAFRILTVPNVAAMCRSAKDCRLSTAQYERYRRLAM